MTTRHPELGASGRRGRNAAEFSAKLFNFFSAKGRAKLPCNFLPPANLRLLSAAGLLPATSISLALNPLLTRRQVRSAFQAKTPWNESRPASSSGQNATLCCRNACATSLRYRSPTFVPAKADMGGSGTKLSVVERAPAPACASVPQFTCQRSVGWAVPTTPRVTAFARSPPDARHLHQSFRPQSLKTIPALQTNSRQNPTALALAADTALLTPRLPSIYAAGRRPKFFLGLAAKWTRLVHFTISK